MFDDSHGSALEKGIAYIVPFAGLQHLVCGKIGWQGDTARSCPCFLPSVKNLLNEDMRL